MDDGGYTPFPSNLPTAPSHGEAWRGGGAGAAPSGFDKQSYELWQYTKSLHYSTADSGDLWRTLTNVRPALLTCACTSALRARLILTWLNMQMSAAALPGASMRTELLSFLCAYSVALKCA